jgi:hypothetical protein
MGQLSPNTLTELFTRFKAGGHAVRTPDGGAQCTALIVMGLRAANARSFEDYSQPKNENYVWGEAIPDLATLRPGDILQFRDHSFMIFTKRPGFSGLM